ncbi:MAG: DUF4837 family protein [Bacteroides sp.]|nr:DUF4837 family protein [Bacteroides sp.]
MKKLLFLTLIVLFAACSTERPQQPSATGRAAELLVVMNNRQFEGHAGEAIREVFQAQVPMVLTEEHMFDLVQIQEESFVKMFETHRHIFMATINDTIPKARLEISKNVWSYPQVVIRVQAPNDSIFRRVLEANARTFIDHYIAAEYERIVNAFNRTPNYEARNAVRDMFGYEMAIPEGFYVAKEGENFLWIRRTGTREDLDMGLLIATLEYKDPAVDFAHETIQMRRDSLTYLYIPGQFEGTYMTTYPKLTPEFRAVNFNGYYAMEARSLWRMENDFMGGPFINYTLVDEANNRLIILDGFVYAPDFEKRDYLRQLEAMIYSLKFTEKEEKEAPVES